MKKRTFGIFDLEDLISNTISDQLPPCMQLNSATTEGLLLRLLIGNLKVTKNNQFDFITTNCYFKLPFDNPSYDTIRLFEELFEDETTTINFIEHGEAINRSLNNNRKNHEIYQKALHEICCYFIYNNSNSIAAFVHLYRCLEYISYTFPMIYASKSKNYRGSYNELKSFFMGDSQNELKFLRRFLSTLFKDEVSTLDYEFEILLGLSNHVSDFKVDFDKVYNGIEYNIDGNTLSIAFKNVMSFFIITRNRFFHFSSGQDYENFESNNYDIEEYFKSVNPYLLNWLSIIILKVSQHGIEAV
jgi:hypothetical protein